MLQNLWNLVFITNINIIMLEIFNERNTFFESFCPIVEIACHHQIWELSMVLFIEVDDDLWHKCVNLLMVCDIECTKWW